MNSDTPYSELYILDDRSISTVNQGTGGKNVGVAIFAAALFNLVTFFGDEWSDEQILSVANSFYDECYWFCLPELKHFTRKCKALKFGKIYGKFNTATFMDWVAQYSEEALYERTGYFNKKLKTLKERVDPPKEELVPDEVVKAAIKDFEAEIALLNEQEQEEANERIRESSRMRKKIDEYMEMVKKTTQAENNEP